MAHGLIGQYWQIIEIHKTNKCGRFVPPTFTLVYHRNSKRTISRS